MSVQKSWAELQTMHRACTLVVETLDLLEQAALPGVSTKELDRIAHDNFKKHGARPAFLGVFVPARVPPAKARAPSERNSP